MDATNANRVKRVVLLVGDNERRRNFFKQAIIEEKLEFDCYNWNEFDKFISDYKNYKNDYALKIDTPTWNVCTIDNLDEIIEGYIKKLKEIEQLNYNYKDNCMYLLNNTKSIINLLNKRKCKKILSENNIAVTKMYNEKFDNSKNLIDFLTKKKEARVFIKPEKASGAAGIVAMKLNFSRKKIAIYTSARLYDGNLYNTKKINRYEDEQAIAILDKILKLDCIVERWYVKDKYNNYCYDLRVIVQDRKIDYIQPRLSKGSITNLHLNNCSTDISNLNLSDEVMKDITSLCQRAYDLFDGLNSVGIDILIEKNTHKPYIIEMNAQGDLMHNDVKNENTIYKNQAKIIKKLIKNNDF